MSLELSAALLVWMRTLPLGLALALFSRALVPLPVALSLTLALTCALLPSAGALPETIGSAALALAVLRELCVGATFALALSFALHAAYWAVHLGEAHELHAELRRTVAVPYALCATWLVLSLRAPLAIVVGLAESFRDAPLAGRVLSSGEFALGVAELLSSALVTAIGFALPLLVSVWLLSLTLAFARRALAPSSLSPQPALTGLLLTLAAALLLVPVAAHAPEGVRQALASARELTRAFAR
jgi:flagellar biosynthesis protein FliR